MKVNGAAKLICEILQEEGYQAWIVGGAVRDICMGHTPKDWDVATNATPTQVRSLFRWTIPTGEKFGTITVLIPKSPQIGAAEYEHIEVTTFRADGHYSDGRRPDDVTFAKTIEEDLSRRDFTCNAIAYDPVNGNWCDPYSGRIAIVDRILNTVGDPDERFREDGLRIMRAVRIAAQKKFTIDTGVQQAIKRCVLNLHNVSKERIRDELIKSLATDPREGTHWTMMELNIFHVICPELTLQRELLQNQHHEYGVWEHTARCVSACDHPNPIVKLAVLLHDIAKPATRRPHPKKPGDFQFLGHEEVGAEMAERWMREYKFSNDEIELVRHCIQHHLIYYTPDWPDKQLRKWYRKVGEKYFDELLYVRRCDIMGKGWDTGDMLQEHGEIAARVASLANEVVHKSSDLAISGHVVMNLLGITQGDARVGLILCMLMDAVTDEPELNTPEQLVQLTKDYINEQSY